MKVIYVGENKINFSAKPSCTYGLNEVIDGNIHCMAESEKRKKILESIKKRKEKIPLSFMQEAFKEAGLKVNNDSDSEEEDEEEDQNKKEENKNNENVKEENKDENINKNAVNNEGEK